MKITYYHKNDDGGARIASFGIYIPQWHMTINNLSVIKGKSSGWFVTLPSFKDKDTQEWCKTVEFDKDDGERFMKAVCDALELYAKVPGVTIV